MTKNKEFFYLQYNKIDWKNQENTKINAYINEYIIQNILLKHKGDSFSLFDAGFGVGFFMRMVLDAVREKFSNICIEGCEPSIVNFEHFANQKPAEIGKLYSTGFLETETELTFDYITSIYVFPHFLTEDLEEVALKVKRMLNSGGRFILVLANEKYLEDKLTKQKDLFIESGEVSWNDKTYHEVLHYSDIPGIGKVIDYNREEQFYLDLFASVGLSLEKQEALNDIGFVCSLFVFKKD